MGFVFIRQTNPPREHLILIERSHNTLNQCLLLSPLFLLREIFNPVRTICYWESNLLRYGSSLPPRNRTFGRPCKLTRADEDALFNILAIDGWMTHDEMAFWLSVERGVVVPRPTICRVLKRNKWTQKNIASLSLSRSEALRKAYIEEMKK